MTASRRLVWKCRRGMRELDILLGLFLEHGYDGLDESDRATFETMLDLPDQDILAWISGAAEPTDPGLCALIETMRNVVHGP